ncbi:glycosyltransferase family 2 protein [bacterium]|nr:glycosyltransferase family 2 protein [bacterium]
MKLVIQIPCYNEEATLATTLQALPKKINGIDEIEVLIINDGSTDKTIDVAKENGVNHIVSFSKNKGLAKAFCLGLSSALDLGADIIVNTDADNQYCADDIEKIVSPILNGEADMVVGARDVLKIKEFSFVKKSLQKLGSFVMKLLSSTEVEDSPSGFRAFSKDVAIRLNVFDNYTYTLETIIQAGAKGFNIKSVPIRVNKDLRKSRLVKNNFDYIRRSMFTMIRMFILYRPFRFFAILSSVIFSLGLILGLRFLYYYMTGFGHGHVQSVVLSAVLLLVGVQLAIFAVLADLLSANRRLLEDIQARLKIKNL